MRVCPPPVHFLSRQRLCTFTPPGGHLRFIGPAPLLVKVTHVTQTLQMSSAAAEYKRMQTMLKHQASVDVLFISWGFLPEAVSRR